MSQAPVRDGPLNSGAINHTQFPGAESGKSIIDLSGTVEVVCALTSIYLLKTAEAQVAPSAVTSSLTTSVRALVVASTAGEAVVAATAQSKLRLGATPQVASAVADVRPRSKFSLTAATSGFAATSAINGFPRASRSATAAAVAATFAFAQRGMPMAGSTTARAVSFAGSLRKPSRSAATSGVVTSRVAITLTHQPPASTVAFSSGQVSTRVNIELGANVVAAAIVGTPITGRNILVQLTPSSAVALARSLSERHTKPNTATGSGLALSAAGVSTRLHMTGSTVASAIAASAATDFAIAAPAPVERLMMVPASDRRMEVTL